MRSRVLLVVLCLIAVCLQTVPAAAVIPPSVYAVDSSVTVRPDASIAVPAANQHASADLIAARNEFESTQVVVEAGDAALDNVSVAMADPGAGLSGPGGATIPAANITIYREADYTVAPDFLSDGEGAVGAWPDPLIPTVDPYYGQARNAFPVDVAAGKRVTAWIDVLVPKGQPTGQYTGTVTVTTADGPLGQVPLRLRVLPFELPSTSSMDTAFQTQNSSAICQAHTNTTTCNSAEKKWALHSLYARSALENRVTLSNVSPLGQGEGPPTGAKLTYFTKYILPLIQGTDPVAPPLSVASEPWSPVRLEGARLTTQGVYGYASWHCLGACVGEWEAFAEQHGYKNRLWLYACDEPGHVTTKWDACEGTGLAANTALRKLVTAHPQDAKNNNDLTKVDIMVTNIRQITGKTTCCTERFEGNQRDLPVFGEFLNNQTAPSNKLWLYTACDSLGCESVDGGRNSRNPGWNGPLWNGWGSYGIDQLHTQARTPGWMVYLYDASGELYYDATAKLRQSWTNSYFFGGNGDGTFFYPGLATARADSAPGAPIIGGTDDIPIESLRLKRVRDSREDYEYLRQLESQDGVAAAQAVAKDLFGERTDTLNDSRTKAAWTTPTPEEMERVRCDLATRIIGTEACTWTAHDDVTPPDTTITVGPGPESTDRTPTFQFTSSEAGSSFACSLDGAAFTPCVSPKDVPVGIGTHSFAVRATDPANNTDPTPAEWVWAVTGDPEVDLVVDGTATRAPAGPNFTFEVRVTNNGPDPATTVTLYDDLPAGVELVSTGTADCGDAGGPWWCDVGDLAVGQAKTFRFVVRPGHEGPFSNTAWAEVEQQEQNLADNSFTGASVGPSFICDIRGTSGADSLVGTSASEVLCGRDGNDSLLGAAGNDLLFGGRGTDRARYTGSPHAMVVNLNFQRPDAEGAWPRHDGQPGHGWDHLASIERALGSSHGDFLLGRTTRADRLFGGSGPDLIYGYGGADTLSGNAGNDELYGGDGSDLLIGGDGSDRCRETTDTRRSCER